MFLEGSTFCKTMSTSTPKPEEVTPASADQQPIDLTTSATTITEPAAAAAAAAVATDQPLDLTARTATSDDEKTMPPPKRRVYVISDDDDDELPSLDVTGIYPLTQASKPTNHDDQDLDADDELTTSLHTRPPTPRAPIRPPPKKRVNANWLRAHSELDEDRAAHLEASPQLAGKSKIGGDLRHPRESTPYRSGLDLLAASAISRDESQDCSSILVPMPLHPLQPSHPPVQTGHAMQDNNATIARLFQDRTRTICMPPFRRNIEFVEAPRVSGANRYDGINRDALYHLQLSSRKHVVLKK